MRKEILLALNKVITSPATRGSKTMERHEFKEYISENFRNSFFAEGVRYTKEEWKQLDERVESIKNLKHLAKRK
jgi:phosphohistidine phosphatase SixA